MVCFSILNKCERLNFCELPKSELHETFYTIKNTDYEKDSIGYYNCSCDGSL